LEGDALVALDKLDKVGPDGVAAELEHRGVEATARDQLLALVAGEGLTLARVEHTRRDHPAGMAALQDLRTVTEWSAATAAGRHLTIDLSLARGLGYYTGCIFEIRVPDLAGSLGGGGRYDGLIGMFLGRDVPACGFSLGLERILVVMEERGMFPPVLQPLDAVVATTQPSRMLEALALSSRLRSTGRRVELRPKAEKPVKLRKYAEQRGARWAVWLEDGRMAAWDRAADQLHPDLSETQLDAAMQTGPRRS
jgi:histidyl-tRNA synthetase